MNLFGSTCWNNYSEAEKKKKSTTNQKKTQTTYYRLQSIKHCIWMTVLAAVAYEVDKYNANRWL